MPSIMKSPLFSIFKKYPNLIVALSEKKDGTMKLTGDVGRDTEIIENRKKFLNKLGIVPERVVGAGLIHGNSVKVVAQKDTGQKIAKTDGLLTKEKNLFLSITVADCLPIFLYDNQQEIVGLIHGGWRSLAQNILRLTVKKLNDEFGSQPKNILAGIGPGISQCHFEVGEEVLTKFQPLLPDVAIAKDKKTLLDLKKIAQIQLINLGLKKQNIEINPDCTYCLADKYFSYRRARSKPLETMLALIGIR